MHLLEFDHVILESLNLRPYNTRREISLISLFGAALALVL